MFVFHTYLHRILILYSFALFRAKDAKEEIQALGDKRNEELQEVLKHVHLKRLKERELEDYLPTKNQRVRLLLFWLNF